MITCGIIKSQQKIEMSVVIPLKEHIGNKCFFEKISDSFACPQSKVLSEKTVNKKSNCVFSHEIKSSEKRDAYCLNITNMIKMKKKNIIEICLFGYIL